MESSDRWTNTEVQALLNFKIPACGKSVTIKMALGQI